ncbi:MAG: AAA family ATPase [Desulfovibrio sp.]|jgi:hypothetical protein|nr:AAA family ATPase [Desulfovibrio sp.]
MSNLQPIKIDTYDFKVIRETNSIYVDKTQYLVKLFGKSTRVFFSRPRRFGKSLMISLLENLYLGRRDLFNGLAIEGHLDDPIFQPHPVIYLDMSSVSTDEGIDVFRGELIEKINIMAEKNNIKVSNISLGSAFETLISQIAERHAKPVILIDEYDCPLVDTYDDPTYQEQIRNVLRGFYRRIKSCDKYIHIAYITGISKFSKIGIFSAANNIVDFSTNQDYCTMFGYTDKEIFDNFSDYLPETAEALNMNVEGLLTNLKAYYDGYTFCGESSVYNPVSVLSFFSSRRFRDYWIETGSQEFIEKYISSRNVKFEDFDGSEYEIPFSLVESPGEITQLLEPALCLYQAGYLTAKKSDKVLDYYLTYPNQEVRTAMLRLVKRNFFSSKIEESQQIKEFRNNLLNGNYAGIFTTFYRVISWSPHEDFEKAEARDDFALECFYREPLFIFLRTAGFDVDIEYHGNLGQPNIVLQLPAKTYVFEIKVSRTGTPYDIKKKFKESVEQMIVKNYLGPHENPVPVCLTVNGKLRRIEYAAIAGDVYEFVPQGFDGPPATFNKISDIKTFLEQFEAESSR